MNPTGNQDVSQAILEIRDLLRLLAAPAIAERDATQRQLLRGVVGNSQQKAKAVQLMDGTRTQAEIHKQSGCHQGNLSTMVKQLVNDGLIQGDSRHPNLVIRVPANFFEDQK